ncbi:bifunctional (p)ppGpp synthetase/guanosine-3',5'-bis(diphosphate) 3'-pyrophosphohydrolase [Kitasatospora cathayae]|uniref:Bifunctional (P)ppGpp synthetase/guanosine-3',5'-bis(Diphosphate) 3'-pyrophosphohydrolase n=1 Tax=Kitasatospora cathayae TaxID=3004092 RepID=A0ABY7QAS8_9ACTN|nr:bifunctional (p)ppGpp synthetase/guanosine-3',5'-bis(diphosphate) 3'-pyrophosphohydrolase [Kitasatospora sp. HUAS 3-15]WBP89867.1 bifunctional (p)ppGpp synthetase/guanosine-3',5'-bis(diphosphate) 3'-pyrophosphohydrolase [Kitasatospora sp. HUAS 3-15]
MPDEVVPTAAAAAPEDRPTPSGATPARPTPTSSRPMAPLGRASGTGGGMRARLARLGGQRSSVLNPVLEPLFRSIRANDPKADPALLRDIERAYAVAEKWHRGQKRKSGDPYITHPLAVATILAELGMDAPTLMAGLLHDTVEDTDYGLETLRKDFGDSVALLVDGVTKLDRVKFGEAAQAETVRKMVVAMAKDPRVLVIKLADRLHNMRTMRYLKREKQEKKARETLEIYAPLAHRLGMNTIKWELEDLAFAILYPKMYDEIVRLVAERAPKRDEYLATVIDQVQADLRGARITASVTGRPKHYYSVYQKMIVRGRDFAEIYDLVGIRVLVDTVRDCYAALGTIHARWNPVPGRFKDYIAMPKFNMYQSLHTTVIGPGGKPVELQIRTFDMHRRAEYGIAAHWKYKQRAVAGASKVRTDTPTQVRKDDKAGAVNEMAWLRQLLDWQKETADPGEFLESLRFDLASNEVFVFTPKGDVIALPAGATPVDFAFAVHTEVGYRTIGARVNGRLVPLESTLENGDTVEVFTSKAENAGPSRDWLGFVKSPRARNKIRAWFSKERREEAIEHGKEAIVRAMRKQGLPIQRILTGDSLVTLAHEMRYPDISSLYAAIGEGHVAAQNIVQKLVQALGGEEGATEDLAETATPTHDTRRAVRRRAKGDPGVIVKGVEDVWVKLSRCCTPVPGDPIVGFVTRGNGVSVHRADCVNVESLSQQPERMIDVEWAATQSSVFLVAIQVEALDRSRLLSDVTRVLSDQHVNILSAAVQTSRDRVAMSRFTFEMGDPKHLGHVLKAVRGVEGVYDVYRVTSARK